MHYEGHGEEKSRAILVELFGGRRYGRCDVGAAHILVQNILGALGAARRNVELRRRAPDGESLVRLYLLVLTALPLFHWAHRFRYYVMDFGILGARRQIAILCYGRQSSAASARPVHCCACPVGRLSMETSNTTS